MTKYYYAVFGKEKGGVYESWPEVQKIIQGSKGLKHRKFSTMEEAQEFSATGSVSLKTETDAFCMWTDGSTSPDDPNIGGYSIVFAPNDERNISMLMGCPPATSARCELWSVYMAMKYANETLAEHEKVVIFNDCNYVVNSVQWIPTWMKNKWKKADGSDVANQDILKVFWKEFKKRGNLEIKKVSGHSGNLGNTEADRLAKSAWMKTPNKKQKTI
jgi:ribonuclease HI